MDQSTYAPDYLILVNKEHKLPADYEKTIELCEIESVRGKVSFAERETVNAFVKLQSRLSEMGIEGGTHGPYRSLEAQKEILERFIRKYGEDYAHRTAAEPGTSEHHTGLAIDLLLKVDGEWKSEHADLYAQEQTYQKIHQVLFEFGFILRYPRGKEAITGFNYEPWHIRYVGKEAAKKIYEQGITLEEYLASKP